MDRNSAGAVVGAGAAAVALRKESVDRNKQAITRDDLSVVALRKESVDRNQGRYLRPADS